MVASLIAVVLGALTWTLLEYCIHRWLGHHRRFRQNPFAAEHIRHHSEGNYFAPTYKKVLAALILSVLLVPPVALWVGWSTAIAYVGGLIGFYSVYEWFHRREHLHPGIGPYGRVLRRHHFYHHFGDSKCNHGVTSPLWDIVFRTYRRPTAVIPVPEKLQMKWLTDPKSGDVYPAHQASYALVRRKPSRKAAYLV